MDIPASDLKLGNILDYDNEIWVVDKTPELIKPGIGKFAHMFVEMKNLRTGNKLNRRFMPSEKVFKFSLERKSMQYEYKDGNFLVFLNSDSFEQVMIDEELLKDKLPFLTDGMNVEVEFFQDKPHNVVLPQTVVFEIQATDRVIKGATVTSSYKSAIMTNGLKVMVPPNLEEGEKIIVKTEDATFVERAE